MKNTNENFPWKRDLNAIYIKIEKGQKFYKHWRSNFLDRDSDPALDIDIDPDSASIIGNGGGSPILRKTINQIMKISLFKSSV